MALVAARPQRIAGQKELEATRVASAALRRHGKPAVILAILMGVFLLLQSRVPLGTAVQIGADEGFEVAKVTLCLHGHKLYSEVWNDQPPLHTFLVTQVVKLQSPNRGSRGESALNSALTEVSGLTSAATDGSETERRDALSYADRQDALSHSSILWPRLVTAAFTVILLACVFVITWRLSGSLAGTLTAALLIASPGFLELSSSCMLEIPALAMAIAGLCVLLVARQSKWYVLSGIFFGVAALMKLVPVYLLPLAALILWLPPRAGARRQLPSWEGSGVGSGVRGSSVYSKSSAVLNSFRSLLGPLLVLGATLLGTFILIDCLIERGAYLAHFQQSWSSHFGGMKSFEYGSPAEHAFDWSILVKNWDVTAPAVLGICVLTVRFRRRRAAVIPLAWLALSLVVFTNHKPWWQYYYVHIAIPLCWCAAIGIESVCSALAGMLSGASCDPRSLSRSPAQPLAFPLSPRRSREVGSFVLRRQAGRAVLLGTPVALFALCAAGWMGARVYLQVASIRNSPQVFSALVLKEIERLKPFTHWLYTDQLVYSFHADIPMPPPLAVVPLKRLWAGDMTNARLAAEMSRFKPEIILLRNDTREVPFQELLDTGYRLIYQDERQRLYADRTTVQRADSAEAQRRVVRGP